MKQCRAQNLDFSLFESFLFDGQVPSETVEIVPIVKNIDCIL